MSAVILNGVFVGLIYGVFGVGLIVVYRGSRVINFAYGETGMLGAFFFTDLRFSTASAGIMRDRGLWLALPAGVLISAALGALTELLVVRPLRSAPRIRPLVGTFAVAALFFTYAARRWGLLSHHAVPLIRGDGVRVAGLQVQPEQLLILGVTIGLLVGLALLYRFTAFGLRLRATALDPYAAELSGVDVDRTSLATWALGGAMAGVSAILIAPLVGFNVAFMTTLSIRGLASALVGGLTSITGALLAGVSLGVAESVIAFKTPVSGITDVTIGALVLVLMVVRPEGLTRSAY